MRSIAVDTTNTYDIFLDSNNNLAMVLDKNAVRQDCLLASQMLLGEFPFDTTRGVTYMEDLFQQKNPYLFEQSLKSNIQAVPNVTEVTNLKIVQVSDVLEYEVTIQSAYGPVEL